MDASPLMCAVRIGAIAQLGERLLCKQEVVGSIPSGSTIKSVPPEFERRFGAVSCCILIVKR